MPAAPASSTPVHQKSRWWGVAIALIATGLISGCSNSGKSGGLPAAATQVAAAGSTSTGSAVAPSAAPAVTTGTAQAKPAAPVPSGPPQQNLRLIKSAPDNGPGGMPFTVTADGLPPGKTASLIWATVDGKYDTTASPENVTFNKRVFTDKRLALGTAPIGTDGTLQASFKAPEDFGEVHDLFLSVDGQDVAHGGFRVMRQVSLSPAEGPIGTPITIKVTGLGSSQYNNTIDVRYDNMPVGIITAVTTRGTTEGSIRASGASGKHVIDIDHGARSVPFLNNQQSGTANIPDWRLWFTLTDDKTMPQASVDWPQQNVAALTSAAAPSTTADTGNATAAGNASVSPVSGPILSQVTVAAGGLQPQSEVDIVWVTARGNRTSPTGWALTDTPLGKGTTGADGTLNAGFQVPDDLGGWHVVKLVRGDSVIAQIPYFVERSLVGVTPHQVKVGDVFTVHIKGVGWTELDNGTAMTYDNAYIGFACGFASNGDVTVNLVATGAPGIHLIDLYPMVYQGSHGEAPWGYQEPLLSYRIDTPGLPLGYRLPAFRLAIEVVN